MPKKYRRNHNLKSISSSRSYSVKELAKKIDVQVKTIHSWIKKGLPIIKESSPIRIHGSDIIQFHKNRRTAQKRPCKDNEMYCCSCKTPRQVVNHEIEQENRTSKIINFIGKCAVCGCRMNRTIPPEKIEYFKRAFCSPKGQQLTLTGF